jgi:hypothetical protein
MPEIGFIGNRFVDRRIRIERPGTDSASNWIESVVASRNIFILAPIDGFRLDIFSTFRPANFLYRIVGVVFDADVNASH